MITVWVGSAMVVQRGWVTKVKPWILVGQAGQQAHGKAALQAADVCVAQGVHGAILGGQGRPELGLCFDALHNPYPERLLP